MKAMALKAICNLAENQRPLQLVDLPDPTPGEGEIIVKISACGVCHTELDEIEGRTPPPRFPVVPGHQAVGTVAELGPKATRFSVGERVGVGWIYSACGRCRNCRSGKENLCDDFIATGRDANGGYAEFMRVKDAFAHKIPDFFSDMEAAPSEL